MNYKFVTNTEISTEKNDALTFQLVILCYHSSIRVPIRILSVQLIIGYQNIKSSEYYLMKNI